MRKFLLGGAAVLGAMASPSFAVTGVSQCQSGAVCAIAFDGSAGTFRNSEVNASPFIDIYTFDVASDGFLNFTLTSSYPAGDRRQDIDFSRVALTGPGGVNRVLTQSRFPEPEDYFSLVDVEVVAGQYTLQLNGTAGQNGVIDASYSGTLNFTAGAVPEPASWALMVLGFGLVGASMRGRRRVARVAA